MKKIDCIKFFFYLVIILIFPNAVWADRTALPPVMIFVSFSMPENSLKEWLNQAEKIKAPVLLRGLVQHSLRITAKKMQSLLGTQKGGMQIDPQLFRRFNISRVPAVVVIQETPCLTQQSCQQHYAVVYGNTTLDYALKRVAQRGDEMSSVAQRALQQLEAKTHG